jgi:transcriptional regulator with XRE-family HTH domain
MSILAQNLKLLRKRKKFSQEDLARELDLTRSTLSAYENELAEPNVTTLLRIAGYFQISLDRLLRQDLSQLSEKELSEIELGLDMDVMGRRLRILTTAIGPDNRENIQLVTAKARAGYTAGYADPEFIAELPKLQLPFLSGDKTYRAFPITGDSMPPVPQGGLVIASYLTNWKHLKAGTFCIVVTQSDGIVFKQVYPHIQERGTLQLSSTNPVYSPYEVPLSDVLEIWVFEAYIAPEMGQSSVDPHQIADILKDLRRDVQQLHQRFGKG